MKLVVLLSLCFQLRVSGNLHHIKPRKRIINQWFILLTLFFYNIGKLVPSKKDSSNWSIGLLSCLDFVIPTAILQDGPLKNS